MSFQSAVNTVVSAPSKFKLQKSLVQQLTRDLEGEQATNLAYQQATKIFKGQAGGYAPTAAQTETFKKTLEQVPVQNREMFEQSIGAVESMSEEVKTLRDINLKHLKQLGAAYNAAIAKKSIAKALWGQSAAELRAEANDPNNIFAQGVKAAKEELKNGKSKTT